MFKNQSKIAEQELRVVEKKMWKKKRITILVRIEQKRYLLLKAMAKEFNKPLSRFMDEVCDAYLRLLKHQTRAQLIARFQDRRDFYKVLENLKSHESCENTETAV